MYWIARRPPCTTFAPISPSLMLLRLISPLLAITLLGCASKDRDGVARAAAWTGGLVRRVQNGDVQRYAALMAVAAAAILWAVLGVGG